MVYLPTLYYNKKYQHVGKYTIHIHTCILRDISLYQFAGYLIDIHRNMYTYQNMFLMIIWPSSRVNIINHGHVRHFGRMSDIPIKPFD